MRSCLVFIANARWSIYIVSTTAIAGTEKLTLLAVITFLLLFLNGHVVYVLMPFVTGWVNRFAHAGDAAMEVAGTTALRVGFSFAKN